MNKVEIVQLTYFSFYFEMHRYTNKQGENRTARRILGKNCDSK
jgi:hypothetical protein